MKNIYLKSSIIFLFFTFSFVNAQPTRDALGRFYSYTTKQHYYAITVNGVSNVPPGYVSEGILCYVAHSSNYIYNSPIFVVSKNGDRIMTTSVTEKNNALSMGYKDEGIIGYTNEGVAPVIPIYRYYNPKKPDHFYTNNRNELGKGGSGYILESTLSW
jgi:hypothetical protein